MSYQLTKLLKIYEVKIMKKKEVIKLNKKLSLLYMEEKIRNLIVAYK